MKEHILYFDGSLTASLDFQEQKKEAQELIEKGFKLGIELDLGLFSKLKKPLSNASQFLSLTLSIKQFKETFWDEFQKDISWVSIYQGSLDLVFDEEQQLNYQEWLKGREDNSWMMSLYCRDTALAYLHSLASDFFDAIPFCLKLDLPTDPLLFALMTHKQVYHPFTIYGLQEKKSNIAICLPSKDFVLKEHYEGLSDVFCFLNEKNIPYRLIPESMLITEWDLVDYLFVLPKTVSPAGKRMLQGFCAAGGTVVTLGGPLHLTHEINFPEFITVYP